MIVNNHFETAPFFYPCLRRCANSAVPAATDSGTARMTPAELASACTSSTEKYAELISCRKDGSSEVR